MKSLRLVSDLEGIPAKTLEDWHYKHQKQLRQEDENTYKPLVGRFAKFELASTRAPDPPPPKPPNVNTDGGLLACSKCRNKHLEERDNSYFCPVCQSLLPAPTWGDYEIKTVSNNPDPFGWMR